MPVVPLDGAVSLHVPVSPKLRHSIKKGTENPSMAMTGLLANLSTMAMLSSFNRLPSVRLAIVLSSPYQKDVLDL